MIDLDALHASIAKALTSHINETAESVRAELQCHINALRAGLSAANEIVPSVEPTKPDYIQVGECDVGGDGRAFGSLKLPFTKLIGYYDNRDVYLGQGANDTVRAIANALSGREGDGLDQGHYRYAILMYRVKDQPKEK